MDDPMIVDATEKWKPSDKQDPKEKSESLKIKFEEGPVEEPSVEDTKSNINSVMVKIQI